MSNAQLAKYRGDAMIPVLCIGRNGHCKANDISTQTDSQSVWLYTPAAGPDFFGGSQGAGIRASSRHAEKISDRGP
jgi:hypothetical protein